MKLLPTQNEIEVRVSCNSSSSFLNLNLTFEILLIGTESALMLILMLVM